MVVDLWSFIMRENVRIKYFSSKKNDNIFHINDQISESDLKLQQSL